MSTLIVQIAQPIGLKPVSQNAKQEMTGQVGKWPPPEYGVPACLEILDAEDAQLRELSVECLLVRL